MSQANKVPRMGMNLAAAMDGITDHPSKALPKQLKLADIIVDQNIQVRVNGLSEDNLNRIQAVLENGGSIDEPVIVYNTPEGLILTDGFHRVEVHRRLKRPTIMGVVRHGSYQDALNFAEDANLKHGQPLTNDDKKSLLFRRLGRGHEWQQTSFEAIGKALGVSRDTVRRWFSDYSTRANAQVDRTKIVGTDGRARDMSASIAANQERAAQKRALSSIGKVQALCTLLYGKYAAKKSIPFMDDPDKGYDWCYQFRYPTYTLGPDGDAKFQADYDALPVGIYQEFLRLTDKATFVTADMDNWTDEQLAEYTLAMGQRPPRQPNGETFQRSGMAQPKNPNLEYQPPAPVGRHRLTEVEATEETADGIPPCPFRVGQRVRFIDSKKQVGPIKDTRWLNNEWHAYVDLGNNHLWVYTGSLERDEITKPSVEPSLVHLSDLPSINDCPFYVDQQVRVIATGEIDTIYNTKWEDGEWRIWLANGEDFNRVHELSPASRFTATAADYNIRVEPQAYKPSNSTQTQMVENYMALMKLIRQITEDSLVLKKFDFNLQYLQPPEVLAGIWDTLTVMRDQTMETFTVVADCLNTMADTGLPYDPILAEEVTRKGMQRG